ncbi:phage tail tape measure protein [Brevibacillus brevis]|nr:phage tail tape measure protein [Brevibacillus brevis]
MSKVYKIAFELAGKLESSFSSSFTQALRDMQQLENRAREIGTIRISGHTFEQIRDSARDAANELRDVERALQAIRGIRLTDQMGPLRDDLRQSSQAVQELQRRLRELERTRGPSLDPMPDETREASSGVDGLIGKFTKMVGVVTTVGTAIVGVFSALSSSDEYVKAMNKIQMATGSSVEQMGEMKEIATKLYNKNLGENWEDLSKSLSAVKSVTKLGGAELENTTRNAILMRDVFEFDIKESVKSADTMVKNFGITSEEAYNLLAQGAQNGLDKSGELLDTANEYSAYFSKLGFSANDMFNIFASGLEAGAFNLDKIGDGIKEFGIRTKDGSKGSLEAYKSIGLQGEEMTKQFATGGKVAQEAFLKTVKAINEVKDPVQRNAASVALFGTQAEDLEERVIKAYGNIKKTFDMTKNTMDEMGKIKYNSLDEFFTGLGRRIETSLITPLSGKLLPILQDALWWAEDMAPVWKQNFDAAGNEIVSFVQGLNLSEAFEPIKQLANEVGPKYLGFMKSIWSATKATFPIFAGLAGILGNTAKSIIKYVAPVVAYFGNQLYPILQSGFQFLANDVFPAISSAIQRFSPQIQAVVNGLGRAFTAVWGVVKPVLDGLFTSFQDGFPMIQHVVMSSIHVISGVIGGLLTTLSGVIDFVTGVFTGDWGLAWTGVKNVFTGIFETLGAALAAPINTGIDMINAALKGINSIKIDVPDWVPGYGGESFSFNIAPIPKVGGYADGGIVSRPELAWIGEGGDTEVVVPINNSQRSLDLWTAAGRMLGVGGSASSGSMSVGDFIFSPSYNFYGNADQSAVKQMENATRSDFEREFNEYKRQMGRVAFT